MMHAGTTISELFARVDNVLAMAQKAREERDAQLCIHCQKRYDEHAFHFDFCPVEWPAQFRKQRFQAEGEYTLLEKMQDAHD